MGLSNAPLELADFIWKKKLLPLKPQSKKKHSQHKTLTCSYYRP